MFKCSKHYFISLIEQITIINNVQTAPLNQVALHLRPVAQVVGKT